ncbi:MAG: chloramphenicol acetyltransferase [Candidatus Bipolaricaulia bacterium]
MDRDREPRKIDVDEWPRREQYELFRSFGFPYLSLTAEVDVARLRRSLREARVSFTVGFVHAVARAANAIAPLRQRLRGDEVVEHDEVHPAITILGEDEQFRFCSLRYCDDFAQFAGDAAERIEEARRAPSLWAGSDRDDFLYITVIPWVSFTGFVHPVPLDPPDSVPRMAWGRFREDGGRIIMPLNIQAHHALVDGIHVGRFYELVQERIDTFE